MRTKDECFEALLNIIALLDFLGLVPGRILKSVNEIKTEYWLQS